MFIEERDGKFHLSVNMISRIQNHVELSHEWELINLKYQESEFYASIINQYEGGPFIVPPGRTKIGRIGVIREPVPGSTNFYVFKDRKSACVLC